MSSIAHHKSYTLCWHYDKVWNNLYSDGEIDSLQVALGEQSSESSDPINKVRVNYSSGESYSWKSKYIDSYNLGQFGIAVSLDGRLVFAQTWENGLLCLDAKTGECVWRTKSKRAVTNVFVNDTTLVCQQSGCAMLLIDMNSGEIIKEKRPSTAWGFTSIDNQHLICQSTLRKWEIIDTETLEVKESFSHKDFTDGHTDFCVNEIALVEKGIIRIRGFKNVSEDLTKIKNEEFEHFQKSAYLASLN